MHFFCRILKFSDSHYTTPQHIEVIEDRGRQGDIILVEGVRTGSAYVWAKIRDVAYAVSNNNHYNHFA
jgi:nuclear pore complex protein Nup210